MGNKDIIGVSIISTSDRYDIEDTISISSGKGACVPIELVDVEREGRTPKISRADLERPLDIEIICYVKPTLWQRFKNWFRRSR